MDKWTIDIKSNRIPSKVMELMRSEKDANLRYLYNHLHQIPKGSTLAGRYGSIACSLTVGDSKALYRSLPAWSPTRLTLLSST